MKAFEIDNFISEEHNKYILNLSGEFRDSVLTINNDIDSLYRISKTKWINIKDNNLLTEIALDIIDIILHENINYNKTQQELYDGLEQIEKFTKIMKNAKIDESKYKILVDAENGELTFKKHCPFEKKIYCVTISLLQLSDLETKDIKDVLINHTEEERKFVLSGLTPSEVKSNNQLSFYQIGDERAYYYTDRGKNIKKDAEKWRNKKR